jgi:predicted RNase H-like nuclease (RuvC/YqgF family)
MMKSATTDKVYKSPVRKLARFFERSRDQWKAKCRKAKETIKCLKNRVRFLEESKERWKNEAQELDARVKQMAAKERALRERLESLESMESKKTSR